MCLRGALWRIRKSRCCCCFTGGYVDGEREGEVKVISIKVEDLILNK